MKPCVLQGMPIKPGITGASIQWALSLVETEGLAVVYTLRGDHEETIRIISGRRADESEKRAYRQF